MRLKVAPVTAQQALLQHICSNLTMLQHCSAPPMYVETETASLSSLFGRGLIFNEETGKTIKIGKGTYQRLLEKGYKADLKNGTMTPPSAAAGMSR